MAYVDGDVLVSASIDGNTDWATGAPWRVEVTHVQGTLRALTW